MCSSTFCRLSVRGIGLTSETRLAAKNKIISNENAMFHLILRHPVVICKSYAICKLLTIITGYIKPKSVLSASSGYSLRNCHKLEQSLSLHNELCLSS